MAIRLFSFRIYNIAYKNVEPQLLEIHKKKTNLLLIFLSKLVGVELLPETWYLKFTYLNERHDKNCDRIFFKSKEEATRWFDFIFEAVFLEKNVAPPQPKQPPPPPPKPKKPVKPLEKLKKPEHLKVVRDEQKKE
jgi:hypothetical protein